MQLMHLDWATALGTAQYEMEQTLSHKQTRNLFPRCLTQMILSLLDLFSVFTDSDKGPLLVVLYQKDI